MANGSRKRMEEFKTVDLGGRRQVSYAEYGDPRGRPLLFFHGWPSSRLQGKLVDGEAKELGYRVIAPDRPGIGETTGGGDERFLGDWPPLVEELASALGIGGKFSVLGVSGGAPYVYACAHAIPERLEAAGILCGAVPLAEFESTREMMLPYRVMLWARKRAPWMMESALGMGRRAAYWGPRHPVMWLLYRFIPKNDRCVVGDPLVHDCVMGSYREAVKNGSEAVVADGDIYTQDWGFHPEDIQFPIHLWHGEKDRNIPAVMVREIAGRLPQCHTRWFPDEGHYSIAANRAGELLTEMAGATV